MFPSEGFFFESILFSIRLTLTEQNRVRDVSYYNIESREIMRPNGLSHSEVRTLAKPFAVILSMIGT
jgi:hypothetical protein